MSFLAISGNFLISGLKQPPLSCAPAGTGYAGIENKAGLTSRITFEFIFDYLGVTQCSGMPVNLLDPYEPDKHRR